MNILFSGGDSWYPAIIGSKAVSLPMNGLTCLVSVFCEPLFFQGRKSSLSVLHKTKIQIIFQLKLEIKFTTVVLEFLRKQVANLFYC